MAEKTPWKAKRQPQEGDRPPVYTSLGSVMNQTPGSKHSTPRSIGGVMNQTDHAMAPSSVVKLGRVMRQK